MSLRFKILFVLMAMLGIFLTLKINNVLAFQLKLENTTENEVYVAVHWVGCPWENFGGVCTIYEGASYPDRKPVVIDNDEYGVGVYFVEWRYPSYSDEFRSGKTFPTLRFEIEENDKSAITVTPESIDISSGI